MAGTRGIRSPRPGGLFRSSDECSRVAAGTAFNVYLRPTGVEVTVSEGTVKVVNAAANEPPPSDAGTTGFAAAVTAGEQADVHDRAQVIHELNSAQISRLLGWRKSSLYFQDQPLGDV